MSNRAERSRVAQVVVGPNISCATLANNAVRCWGQNTVGALGNGTTTNSPSAGAPSGISTATDVSSGTNHTCSRLTNGTAMCWGDGGAGQLGISPKPVAPTPYVTTPVSVSGLTGATRMDAGHNCTCAVALNSANQPGGVKCWGNNGYGNLGDGTNTSRDTPVSVIGISDAISVSAGAFATCALRSGGGIKCWGAYQLGAGSPVTGSYTPVDVLNFP